MKIGTTLPQGPKPNFKESINGTYFFWDAKDKAATGVQLYAYDAKKGYAPLDKGEYVSDGQTLTVDDDGVLVGITE